MSPYEPENLTQFPDTSSQKKSSMKVVLLSLMGGAIFAGLFSFGIYTFASPPGSAYSPGETLDPSCTPGSSNCTVTSPVPYTGATTNVDLGSNNFTTTGTVTAGLLKIGSVITFPTSDGTNGQFLRTNGSGTLSWVSGSGGAAWGSITGTLSDQTDLQTALDAKANLALSNLASVAINTSLIPGTSDGAALGSTSKMWSDLFLASGGVINFNNGDVTLTHASDSLALAGGVLTIPTNGLTINATNVTSTGTQLNYLNAATGTTGTTSTNLVFSTSPTLVTPTLGVATATSINGLTITSTAGTLTIPNNASAALILSGNFGTTLTATGTTNVTLPTTGTLSTLAGAESLTNKKLGSLTSNGFVKTSGGDGTLSVDTATYLTSTTGATAALDNLASVAINTSLIPGTSDGAALGSTSKMWSDLFLASGGVINFNNGDVTLTHASDSLALAGGVLTIPTNGLTINATNVTSTGTQLNYLNAATGTTGTTSTNLVFSTSPTLVTPNIGAATGTSVVLTNTGGAQATLKYDASNYTTFTANSNGDLTITTATGTTGGAININSAITGDFTFLSSNGTVALGGTGGSNNEDLLFDFETASNRVGISSGTGVTDLDLGSLNLITTGIMTMGGSTTGTLVTRVSAGAATESDANGALVVDSSNGRIYFRYGGGWHYVAQTAGYQIPGDETLDPVSGEQIKMGDFVLGVVSKTDDGRDQFDDGALHAKSVRWETVKQEFIEELLEAGYISETGAVGNGGVPGVSGASFSDRIIAALGSLGVTISNGAVAIGELAVQTFTAKTAKIEKLEMIDSATGQAYCTWIQNGEWQKVQGTCDSLSAPAPEPVPSPEPEPEPVVEETPPSDTPEVAPEPAPIPDPIPSETPVAP